MCVFHAWKDGDVLVRVLRISFVGELGYELHIPNDKCADVYQYLLATGKSDGLRNAGYRALYSLSCEKGIYFICNISDASSRYFNIDAQIKNVCCSFNLLEGYHLWGYDLRADDTPIEANLGFTCRKTGKYLGKAAIERQRNDGVQKRLVFLTLETEKPLWGWEGVYRNGKPVGLLRRGDYAFELNKPIGRAFINNPDGIVDDAFISSGNYQIDVMGKLYPAECYLKSPFDRKNQRIFGIYN